MVFTSNWKAASSSPSTTNNNSQQQQTSTTSPFMMMSPPSTSYTNNSNNAAGKASSLFIGGGGSTSSNNITHAMSTDNSNKHDFESLLANSSSLLSSIGRNTANNNNNNTGSSFNGGFAAAGGSSLAGNNNNQSNNSLGDKSLLELSVASRGGSSIPTNNNNTMVGGTATAATTATTTTYESEASAHRLLAREGYGFNSALLGRHVRELERRATTTAGGSGGRTSAGNDGMMMDEEEKKDEGGNFGAPYHPPGVNTQSTQTTTSSSSSSSSIQKLLQSHHEYCITKSISSSRQLMQEQLSKRINKCLMNDWEMKRNEILGNGGGRGGNHRFLMGGVGGGGEGNSSSSAMGGGGTVASRVPLLEDEDDYAASPSSLSTTNKSSSFSNIVPSSQPLSSNIEPIVKSHLNVIDKYLTSTTTTSSSSPSKAMALLTSLQDCLKDISSLAGISSPDSMNGYNNALSFVQSIVNCNASLGIDLITTPTNNNYDNPTMMHVSVVAGSVMGSCNFFARQYMTHVKDVVRESELLNNNSGGGGGILGDNSMGTMARDVCKFATIVAGRDVVNGRGGVWPCLFYCLRCGDLVAANSVLQQFGPMNSGSNNPTPDDMSAIDPAVSDIVSQLAQLQSSSSTTSSPQDTIFGDTTNGNTRPVQQLQSSLLNPTQVMMQARLRVADLYERTKTRSTTTKTSDSTTNIDDQRYMYYRTACLAMLGGSESISEAPTLESSGLVKTVEDYLYASLWHALHLAEASSSSLSITGSAVADGGGSGLRRVAEAVARLSVLINQWGPTYFEEDEDVNGKMYTSASTAVALSAQGGTIGGPNNLPHHKVPQSGGWAYALPLMASQQYASALAYLAEAGGGLGLLQASHLSVVMDLAGLSIDDFTMDEKKISQCQTLLPMLVSSYSASLQGLDAGAALKYLVLLADKGKFVKEQVQRLVLETRQFETLAGRIEPNGIRSNGALDAYFTKREVSSLLVDCANNAIRIGKPADAAELLVLSGRFGALFSLMNRELASYLNASTPEEVSKRQFWFNAASQFHAIHLAQGRTYVQNKLNEEGNLSLGNTFQLLMNLVVFFDRCRDQQWEGAWVLIDELQLIPKTESEMTVKVEAFRGLDNCVRQVFHHVVLAAMEALCHLFRNLKQSGAGVSVDQHNTIDQSLNELRSRARLLVTFSRLLNLPSLGDSDTYVRMSQLEKNMM